MQAHLWGLKTLYYSLGEKTGSKDDSEDSLIINENEIDEEDCSACKL